MKIAVIGSALAGGAVQIIDVLLEDQLASDILYMMTMKKHRVPMCSVCLLLAPVIDCLQISLTIS